MSPKRCQTPPGGRTAACAAYSRPASGSPAGGGGGGVVRCQTATAVPTPATATAGQRCVMPWLSVSAVDQDPPGGKTAPWMMLCEPPPCQTAVAFPAGSNARAVLPLLPPPIGTHSLHCRVVIGRV